MLSLFKVFMSEDVGANINNTLMSGYITQGKKVEEFENKLKNILIMNIAEYYLNCWINTCFTFIKNPDDTFDWPGFNENKDIVLTPALTCFATTSS